MSTHMKKLGSLLLTVVMDMVLIVVSHMIKILIQDRWFHWVTNTLFVSREVLEWVGLLRRCVHHCYTAILQVNYIVLVGLIPEK